MKIYLAAPYSSAKKSERDRRYAAINQKAAELMLAGNIVFSPVSHSHSIADHMPEERRCDHDLWMRQDLWMIEYVDELWVYCLPGWEISKGVYAEVTKANELGKPVAYFWNRRGF